MGFTFNGLSGAAVAISGSVDTNTGALGATKTKIVKSMNQLAVANTIYSFYTVTAGKTLYVESIVLACASVTATIRLGASLSGNAYSSTRVESNVITAAAPANGNTVIPCNGIVSFAAGSAIEIQASDAANMVVLLIGWEA